jgi:hypothetical protein
MQVIPVDAARLGTAMCVVPPAPRLTPEGVQRADRDGRPLWVVGLSVRQLDGRRAEVLEVAVPGEPPGLEEGARVRIEGLEAVQWAMGDRSGTSWRAAAVVPENTAAATAASAGGRGKSAAGGERS